tara:strand:- start:3611 stop:3886 length:276 start_codon:yes stop_codon:yes gene_type:complete
MDLSDLIQGGDQTPRNEFIYYSKKGVLEGLRQGDWKVRLIGKKPELYNLAEDIGERNNLAKSQPERTSNLIERMNQPDAKLSAEIRPIGKL